VLGGQIDTTSKSTEQEGELMTTKRRAVGLRIRHLGSGLDERLRAARARLLPEADVGMSTAEYAIGTVAACAFAALLYKVVTSGQILNLLTGVVSRALHVPF
jgi:hypothetical protein